MVTATEVARLAGVSQSTVSRVFYPNKDKPVSEELRQRVLKAAQMLDYRPNALARGLIMKKTNLIGIVIGDINNSFFSNVLEKLTVKLKHKGFDVLFVHKDDETLKKDEELKFLDYNVAGIIVIDAWLSSNIVDQLIKNEIPVILTYRNIENANCNYIGCDNFTAGYKTAEYFYKHGHRHFAYMMGDEDSSTNKDRQAGYCSFLIEKGIVPYIEKSGYSYESGFEAGYKLFSKQIKIDSLFCADDIMAIGVIDAARRLGLTIGEDISIVGFDDITMASWDPYSLSTWRVPLDNMVNLTIDTLLKEIHGENDDVVQIELPCKFIERKSVKTYSYKNNWKR